MRKHWDVICLCLGLAVAVFVGTLITPTMEANRVDKLYCWIAILGNTIIAGWVFFSPGQTRKESGR